jgi:26S proteasome regulatory subunit N3
MPDVEMKPAEPKAKEAEKKDDQEKPTPPTPAAEIKSNLALIERAVSTLEPRFTHRVLRTLTALRKRIDASVLREALEEAYVKGLFQPVFAARIQDSRVSCRHSRKEISDIMAPRSTST